MAKRSRKIDRIVSIAEAEERRHGELTGRSQSQLNEQRNRLGALQAYRVDYAGKGSSVGSVSSSHWKDYQAFLARLDDAVRSQQQIVRDCEQAVEVHRQRWMEKRKRVESLTRVRDRFRDEEARHAERLEQRRLDDLPTKPAQFED
ncbi:MAG: flagellar export protein FliJ [Woeseiaceae bacterium]|nr:flagellar export protein FliJ [Woeseiaceae bacterium]